MVTSVTRYLPRYTQSDTPPHKTEPDEHILECIEILPLQEFSHRLRRIAWVDKEGWKTGDRMILRALISSLAKGSSLPRANYGHTDPTHHADVLHLFARILWDQQAIDGVDGGRVVGRW